MFHLFACFSSCLHSYVSRYYIHNSRINLPSASLAINWRRPVVPKSIPVLSSSSLSKKELALEASVRSVTWPTFMGLPASSNPLSCSKAFLAHSESENYTIERGIKGNYLYARQRNLNLLMLVYSIITSGRMVRVTSSGLSHNVINDPWWLRW